MLVIASDLHLTDGTTSATLEAEAFDLFAERLRGMAFAASHRTDGSYRPVDHIDVLLLGDVLDVTGSGRWLARKDVRPWTDPRRPEFIELVTQITGDILRHNDAGLTRLRGLAGDNALRLPPADGLGKPARGAEGQPVPLHIHYMVGNHDWYFRLPGPSYDLLRQALVRHLGLAQEANTPFPHDPHESGELADLLLRHRALAQHGDVFDPLAFDGDRNASSLAEALTIEVLARFGHRLETELADKLPAHLLAMLGALYDVRPLLLAPVWLDGLLNRTCPRPETRTRIKQVWDELVEQFLELPFVAKRDPWNSASTVDGLGNLLRFGRRQSRGWAAQAIAFMNQLRGASEASYRRHALAEADFRNRRARHIVYGHTHLAESVPLDASYAEGFVLNQMYFNTGCWRRVHAATAISPGENEFVTSDAMTLTALYAGDERQGRPYEIHTGLIGLSPIDLPMLRFDAGRGQQEAASGPQRAAQGPHFHAGAAKGNIVPTRRR